MLGDAAVNTPPTHGTPIGDAFGVLGAYQQASRWPERERPLTAACADSRWNLRGGRIGYLGNPDPHWLPADLNAGARSRAGGNGDKARIQAARCQIRLRRIQPCA